MSAPKPNKKKQSATKRPTQTPKVKGGLVVPEHGRGKIWQGPAANPVAGPGRPADAIRAAMRGSLESRLSVLEQIIDSAMHDPGDRIRAIDVLAKYGLGTKDELDISTHPDAQRFVKQVYDAVALEGPEVLARVQARLTATEGT